MKRTLIIIAGVFASLVVIGTMYFLYFFTFVQPALNKESKAWVDETVPRIVTTWNVDETINNSSPELLQIMSREDIKVLFSTRSTKLGPFKKYNGSTGEAGIEINIGHKFTTAEYTARTNFINGAAEISIRGIKENGAWKILEFHVNVIQSEQ
jgi:hypothetical protein